MKTTTYGALLILIAGCQNPATTTSLEAKSIRSSPRYDSAFQKLVNEEIITNPEDKKFISDITQLQPVRLVSCDSMAISYEDSVDEKRISLTLSLKRFDKKKHAITYNENGDRELIDGKEPWGGFYTYPETEIDALMISVNGKFISMKDELRDLFNFDMCDSDSRSYFNPNPLLKYDKENKVFYLYVKGGNAADSYFGKIIFDEGGYLKRYLVHYGQLSKTGSFGEGFKGF
ncbi:MAG: hypothetical protein AB8F95_15250 [Bacteroidia bacterium]